MHVRQFVVSFGTCNLVVSFRNVLTLKQHRFDVSVEVDNSLHKSIICGHQYEVHLIEGALIKTKAK